MEIAISGKDKARLKPKTPRHVFQFWVFSLVADADLTRFKRHPALGT